MTEYTEYMVCGVAENNDFQIPMQALSVEDAREKFRAGPAEEFANWEIHEIVE